MPLTIWTFIELLVALFVIILIVEIRTTLYRTNKTLDEIRQSMEEIKDTSILNGQVLRTSQENENAASKETGVLSNEALPPEAIVVKQPTRFEQITNRNWVDEIISEYQNQGGFDNLPGKGKPLNIDPNADVFSGILKKSGALPPWLALQHEIRSDLQRVISSMGTKQNFNLETAVKDINVKINKFNAQCPTPLLEKPLISPENIVKQYEKWK